MSTFEGLIRLNINGCFLQAVKRNGVWRFLCREFPELPVKYSGDNDPVPACEHFIRLALMQPAPAETPRRSA